jgi:predicted MFS family arabinose efflux permease
VPGAARHAPGGVAHACGRFAFTESPAYARVVTGQRMSAAEAIRSRPSPERLRLVSAILFGVIGPEIFIVQPGFVQGLVQYLGFTDQSAGYAESVEMWGMVLTTVLMTFLSHRFNWRTTLVVSVLLMTIGNGLCIGVHSQTVFVALRLLVGLGAGSIVSLSFTTVGLTSHPDRNFGYLIMWVLAYGAVGLWLMPSAFASSGMTGVLAFFALFPLLGLTLVRHIPISGEAQATASVDARPTSRGLKGAALAAMLCYFTAQGAVWAYLFLIGTAGGLGEQQVANGLMLSQFAGVAGAMVPAVVGNRFGRTTPLTVGILGGVLCLPYLLGRLDYVAFAIDVCLYNFFWNMTHPFLLATMASLDARGRVVSYAVAMQMIGLAVGPALAASVIAPGHYAPASWTAGALFLLSWLAILPPVIGHARSAASATPADPNRSAP